jgi:acetolactate synthase I/II/III large subunit
MTRGGGRLLADQLALHGADLAFCVPGESYLPLLDGLYDHRDDIRVVTCRHEAAACNAAEAYGKLTGRPGICLVTRGPGATHAANGVHTARQDSTPLVLLVGQVARGERGRESFQELDYEQVFGPMTKWAFEVGDTDRIPELVARAFATAVSGRPGPVMLALPEDVLSAETDAADAAPYQATTPVPAPPALRELRARLERAERPFVLVGGGPWDEPSARRFSAWAQACGLPVGATFRRQDIVDNRLACYAGDVGLGINPALAARIREADLIVAVGTRLTEIETQGYTLLAPPRPAQALVHVHPDPGELGRVYQADLPILAGMRPFAAALEHFGPVDGGRWGAWAADARADYVANLRHEPAPGSGVDLGEVMAHLRAVLPEDAIVCNGAGNYTVWVHRFLQYRRFGTQLAPQSGSMGYGLPAALAAQLVHPDRLVVAFAGDGCFQMSAHELATAVQERLPIVVVVVNNGTLGTIRMHQERRFPGRVIGTDLVNPDFVALARAYGAAGERVHDAAGFPAAFERARAADRPAVVELVTDPEALTPRAALSAIRAEGERSQVTVAARDDGD